MLRSPSAAAAAAALFDTKDRSLMSTDTIHTSAYLSFARISNAPSCLVGRVLLPLIVPKGPLPEPMHPQPLAS